MDKIAITTGDPNGIGAEITIKALNQLGIPEDKIVIISNKKILGYDISIFFEKILQSDFLNTIFKLNLSAEEMDNINKNVKHPYC